ncbi:hypothetical protein [Roseibium sp.]|uniref:hypothetical protein n=1 Tax=Roseibium sp. TaxID=1936156 RepID=UPI003279AAD5
MAETMIERVARAMEPILFGGLPDGQCGPATARARATAREKARAAIEAMREPTEAMVTIGACREDQDHDIFEEGHIAREVWLEMIDAALKETN